MSVSSPLSCGVTQSYLLEHILPATSPCLHPLHHCFSFHLTVKIPKPGMPMLWFWSLGSGLLFSCCSGKTPVPALPMSCLGGSLRSLKVDDVKPQLIDRLQMVTRVWEPSPCVLTQEEKGGNRDGLHHTLPGAQPSCAWYVPLLTRTLCSFVSGFLCYPSLFILCTSQLHACNSEGTQKQLLCLLGRAHLSTLLLVLCAKWSWKEAWMAQTEWSPILLFSREHVVNHSLMKSQIRFLIGCLIS